MSTILRIIFLLGVCWMVQGQVDTALQEVKSYEIASLSTLTWPFNSLRDDISGSFFRSQTALRLLRQGIFTTSSRYPYYQLNDTMRSGIMKRMTTIISECLEPTIDYLQKDAILPYFNFMTEARTPIESGFQVVANQLRQLETAIKAAKDLNCLRTQNINRARLTTEYGAVVNAESECIRNASNLYRAPIGEFNRAQITVLPFVTRINAELILCSNENIIDNNQCIGRFLATYCDDESKCKVCSTITDLKKQAESMVNMVQPIFKDCLLSAAANLPVNGTLVENVKKCATAPASSSVVVEENSV